MRAVPITTAAVAALTALVLSVSAPAAAPAKTALAFRSLARSFDYDHGRVAWIDRLWVLHTRDLRTGVAREIPYTSQYEETPLQDWNNSLREFVDVPWDRQLVLEQRGLLWLSSRGCMGGPPGATLCEHVYTGSIDKRYGMRLSEAESVHGDGGEGRWLTGIAAVAQGFSYGAVEVSVSDDLGRLTTEDGGVWTVVRGMPRKLRDTPPALVLARFAGRIAIEPADTSERGRGAPLGDGTVEIRDVMTGVLVSSFSPGKVRALVLTTTSAVVLVGRRIDRYCLATGRLLASTPVPAHTASDLDVDGSRVVFRTDAAVKVLDTSTGRIATIATTPAAWHLTHVAIDGGSAAWTESRNVAPDAASRQPFETRVRIAPV